MSKSKFDISVRLMTYNHEQYIIDCLKGINLQETDLKIQIVVGDDFSKDSTLSIIKNFKFKKNFTLKILKRKKGDTYYQKRQKLGRLYNFINILENCEGKYIAFIDGDDYWVDKDKLQNQYEFLENNKNYIACSSKYTTSLYHILKNEDYNNGKTYTYEDSVYNKCLPTVALFFKRPENYKSLKEISFYESPIGDSVFITWLVIDSGKKKLFNSNKITSFYRIHENGVFSSIDLTKKRNNISKSLVVMNKLTKGEFDLFLIPLSVFYNPEVINLFELNKIKKYDKLLKSIQLKNIKKYKGIQSCLYLFKNKRLFFELVFQAKEEKSELLLLFLFPKLFVTFLQGLKLKVNK